MRHNTLSGRPVPKILLVAEGALVYAPPEQEARFNRLMEHGYYDQAADLLVFNPLLLRVMWDRAVRRDLDVQQELVTYLGPDDWARALSVRVRQEEVPVKSVWATTPQKLGRKLVLMPEVIRVYDPWPEHQLMYPAHIGRYLDDVNRYGLA